MRGERERQATIMLAVTAEAFVRAREVVAEAGRRRLLSDEHFSVDGTLLEAWASLKSYRPRDEQEPPSSAVGGGRKLRYRERRRNRAWLELTAAAYNLVRISRLEPVPL